MGKLFRVHALSNGVHALPAARRSKTSAPGKGFCDTLMLTEPQSPYRPTAQSAGPLRVAPSHGGASCIDSPSGHKRTHPILIALNDPITSSGIIDYGSWPRHRPPVKACGTSKVPHRIGDTHSERGASCDLEPGSKYLVFQRLFRWSMRSCLKAEMRKRRGSHSRGVMA
ncbi:hypothetical protein EI94DRAFT_742253 [Lactarius quietus]|nr:hypothetical protein EI94DRAFT_742253 [Lactarius quietus]